MSTEILKITEIGVGEAQKEVMHNVALRHIEALLTSVASMTAAAPPAAPTVGLTHIVGTATGVWVGKLNQIAHFFAGAWYFYPPANGLTMRVTDQANAAYTWDGAAWASDDIRLPIASLTKRGIVELATNAETIAGVDDVRAVTPAGFATANAATAASKFFSSAVGWSRASANLAADATEADLVSVTIPAGLMSATGALRVTATWSVTNSATAKRLSMRIGGTGQRFLYFNGASALTVQTETIISNNGLVAQKGHSEASSGFGTSAGAIRTSAVDTALEFPVKFTAAWDAAVATETITLERYIIEVIR